MKSYTLRIDHEKCWGCKTCEVACKQEFDLGEGIRLISVIEHGPKFFEGKPYFQYHISVCRQCDNPPCAEVCPEQALNKRDDGIVVLDGDLCNGCKLCLAACPYDAIVFDEDRCIAHKCNLCHHRVDQGLIPSCADNICLAHCIHFLE